MTIEDSDKETLKPGTACGNVRHPDGPWHQAAPLPFYGPWWNRKARLAQRRYERNVERWGCGCDSDIAQRLIEATNLLEQVHRSSGNWTTPSVWNDERKKFLRRVA